MNIHEQSDMEAKIVYKLQCRIHTACVGFPVDLVTRALVAYQTRIAEMAIVNKEKTPFEVLFSRLGIKQEACSQE